MNQSKSPQYESETYNNGIFIKKNRNLPNSNKNAEPEVGIVMLVPHDCPPDNDNYDLNDNEIFAACQEKDPTLTREDFETYKNIETDKAAFQITLEIFEQISALLSKTDISFEITLLSESKLHRGFVDINRRPTNRKLVHQLTRFAQTREDLDLNTALRELCMEDPFHKEGPIRKILDSEKSPELIENLEIKHLSSLATIWREISNTRGTLKYYIEGHSMCPGSPDIQTLSASKTMDEGTLGIRQYNNLFIEASENNHNTRPDICIITHERTKQDLRPFIDTSLSEEVAQANIEAGINAQANSPYAGTDALTSVAAAKTFGKIGQCVILDYNKRLINNDRLGNMTPKSQEELAAIAAPTAISIVSNIIHESSKKRKNQTR